MKIMYENSDFTPGMQCEAHGSKVRIIKHLHDNVWLVELIEGDFNNPGVFIPGNQVAVTTNTMKPL